MNNVIKAPKNGQIYVDEITGQHWKYIEGHKYDKAENMFRCFYRWVIVTV